MLSISILVGCNGAAPAVDARPPDRPAPGEAGLDGALDLGDASRAETRADRSADGPFPGLRVARFLSHLHSVYSHDGCDGKGLVGGKPDATCLKELRSAVCAAGLDAALLTDHPANMSSHTMQEDLLFDAGAGDQLVVQNGKPIANRIACTGGGSALLLVGFETGSHATPLGLEALPADPDLYQGFADGTDPATTVKRVKGVQALGAVASVVHSEEDDLSVKTIVDSGIDAMEWYNMHANMKALIGADSLSFDVKNIPQLVTLVGQLNQLKDFLSGAVGGPKPDLAYLMLLDRAPQAGFQKWQQAQGSRPVTGLLGSDIHQNVSVDATVCAGLAALGCQAALALAEGVIGPIPLPVKELLLKGGPLLLSDGARIDGYARLMRWMENRVLLPSISPQELKEGIRKRRVFGVFTVFGDPAGFGYTATRQGSALAIGDSGGGSLTLLVKAPDRPAPLSSVSFTPAEAAKAQIRTRLMRADTSGAAVVGEASTPGTLIQKTVTQPGAYFVEVRIKPQHLVAALGTSKALADKEYLWLITNPIYLTP